MKRVSSTEARKDFFNLLDHAASGNPVFIERKGVLLRLVREKSARKKTRLNYKKFIKSGVDKAETWSWEWSPGQALLPIDHPSK